MFYILLLLSFDPNSNIISIVSIDTFDSVTDCLIQQEEFIFPKRKIPNHELICFEVKK